MKKYLLFLVLFSQVVIAQTDEIKLPEGLGFSNQLEYSYDKDKKFETMEDWLNLDYRYGIFSAGLRYDFFQPNDPSPAISRGKEKTSGISYKYIKMEIGDVEEGLDITAGGFYALFGRGLVLKSYEDRNIRIDNNLEGVKVVGRYANFTVTALSGMPENASAERTDILHAMDVEYKGLDNLRLGASFASNQPDDDNAASTNLASIRIEPSIWNFDLYAEYGVKHHELDSHPIGKAFYGSLNFYYDNFSAVGEYKYYDNFAFTTNDQTVFYNTPPAVRKEYAYILLNRHPSPLNQNNEQGFLIEANYNFTDYTYLNAAYSKTQSLPQDAFYQKVNNLSLPVSLQLEEAYLQFNHKWNDNFTTIAAFAYNEEHSTSTKSVTPILENRYYFGDVNTLKLVIEHQQSSNLITDEKYYDDVFTLEYLRSPKFSVSVVAELQTKEPLENHTVRKVWSFIQFGYKIFDNTDASILFGNRQAGNICIGGVCRYEPEFSGVELKIFTRI